MKKKAAVFFLILNIVCIKLSSENIFHIFGNKTNHVVVFAASFGNNGEETASTKLLKKLGTYFESHKPEMTVIIALSSSDISDLPDTIPIKKHADTKNIIKKLNEYSSPLIFLLEDGGFEDTEIIAGAEKITSPAWLFSNLYNALASQKVKINFNFYNFPLYRIGIINNDKILGEYLKSGIPAIKLKTSADISEVFISIPQIYKKKIPQKWDKHYLAKKVFGKLYIIEETVLVYIIIAVIGIGLFFLFAINFPFYKTKDVNLTSRWVFWIIPFSFFIITFISLFISSKIVSLLFFLRFKTFSSVEFLPLTASLLKLSLTLLFIILFSILNNILNLRPTQFICGYMSNIICLINIFIFSYIDFSLSLLFLEIYIISFFAHRIRNIFIQLIFSVIIIIPVIPYAVISFNNPAELLNIFFKGSDFISTIGLLPIVLLYNKLLLKHSSIKSEKNIKGIIFPVSLLIAGFIISAILVFSIKPWTKKNPMEIIIYQNVYKNNISTVIKAPITLPKNLAFSLKKSPEVNSDSFFKENFGKTNISFYKYSERNIGEITSNSKLQTKALEVQIKSNDAFPVYESNWEFERGDNKQSVEFIFPQNPPNPFLLSFTSGKNMDLDITVRRWSYDNIFDTRLENLNDENIKIKFIMEICESFKLLNGDLIE